jgi:hypothetical protein
MPKGRNPLKLLVFAAFFVAAVAASAASAPKPVPTPVDWERRVDGTNLQWGRMSSYGTNIVIAFDVAERSSMPVRQWFEKIVGELTEQGTVISRAGISQEGDLLKDALVMQTSGESHRIFVFGYPTSQGNQPVVVMMMGDVRVGDSIVQQAFDIVAKAWRENSALNSRMQLIATTPEPGSRPVPPGTTAATSATKAQADGTRSKNPPSNASTSGPKGRAVCRDEMRTITTMQLQQVCYPSVGGMSNCQLQSVPVQQQVLQQQCY